LSKASSGVDESYSGFTEGSSDPKYFTSGQIEIISDLNKFTFDVNKDSSSSGEHVLFV